MLVTENDKRVSMLLSLMQQKASDVLASWSPDKVFSYQELSELQQVIHTSCISIRKIYNFPSYVYKSLDDK
nr:MAG TPA: hypothetical protein [Microviridae sp.]